MSQPTTEDQQTYALELQEAFKSSVSQIVASPLEMQILEQTLMLKTPDQIALELRIPPSSVRTFLRRKEVKEYLKELKEALNEIHQLKLQGIMSKMIDGRIERMVEQGEGFADLSRRDTLDIIKAFADITNNIAKQQSKEDQDNVFVNIYQQVLTK